MIYFLVPAETDLKPLEDANIDYDIWNAKECLGGAPMMSLGVEESEASKAKELLKL